jgi:hypothetical protein
LFQIIIFTLFSFAISIFISDNFKFSKNNFIKFIQKFVIFISILALILLIGLSLYLLELDFSFISKSFVYMLVPGRTMLKKNIEENNKDKSPKEEDIVRVTSKINDKK